MPAKKPAPKKSATAWIRHVKKYWKEHPKLTYQEAMIKASPSYHKK